MSHLGLSITAWQALRNPHDLMQSLLLLSLSNHREQGWVCHLQQGRTSDA